MTIPFGQYASIGQYAPVSLPGEAPSLTEKPCRPQSTGSQRVRHYRSDPVHIGTRLLLPVAAVPQWELSAKVAQLLGLQRPLRCQVCRDTDCLCRRSYGPIRVFFLASCSWWSEGLFGRSLFTQSGAERLPCLRSLLFSKHIRHIEGPPWLRPYSVVQCIRCLRGQPFYCSAAHAGMWGERGYGDGSSPTRDSAVWPCFHSCPTFLHRHFPP